MPTDKTRYRLKSFGLHMICVILKIATSPLIQMPAPDQTDKQAFTVQPLL